MCIVKQTVDLGTMDFGFSLDLGTVGFCLTFAFFAAVSALSLSDSSSESTLLD